MVTLVGTMDCDPKISDYGLIRHWLRHFVKLGIDSVALGLRYNAPEHLDNLRCIIGSETPGLVTLYITSTKPFTSVENECMKRKLIANALYDWVAIADVDEFPELPPEQLHSWSQTLEPRHVARGTLTDYRGLGFPDQMKPVIADLPLHQQFANMTQGFNTLSNKVFLFNRIHSLPCGGHHFAMDTMGVPVPESCYVPANYQISHYKWTSSCKARTLSRIPENPPTLDQGSDLYWSPEMNFRIASRMGWL